MPICPRCHQPIRDERCGVYLPPRKSRIMDVLIAAGDIGISTPDLINAVWADEPRSPNTLKSHITQLNDLLAGTDFHVRSDRAGRQPAMYYLTRGKRAVA
jgi:DNA-binding response OmpR family regulator